MTRADTHPPEDLLQHPGHLLRRSVQAMNLIWAQEVSRTITSPQFAALNALLREPDLDQRTLGRRVSLDRSTTAEMVARLTDRGLIRRERHSYDGRRKTIALTPRGESVLQQLIPRTHAMTDRLVAGLTERERKDLLRLLLLVVRASEQQPKDVESPKPADPPQGARQKAGRTPRGS
jgi:DNA-binding MarR family transcriptional regulator